MEIKIKKLHPESVVPSYAHDSDAGMDVYSCEDVVLKPGERRAVKTGISTEFAKDYVALVWDKGGVANKGVTTIAGVIDSSYRGEWLILLLNVSNEDYVIKKGTKIAQVLIQKFEKPEVQEITDLSETSRGEGKFGSTGMN